MSEVNTKTTETESANDRFGSKTKLSGAMESCRRFIEQHGGEIRRYPGGYWAGRDYGPGNRSSFGTTTVEALVARGVIEYTEWQEGRNGRFPVAAVICSSVRPGEVRP